MQLTSRLHAALASLAAATLVASCGGGGGGGGGDVVTTPPPAPPPVAPAPPGAITDATAYSVAATASLPSNTAESEAVTQHTITLPAGPLAYTARTGHLVTRDATGAAQASMFHISYLATGGAGATRPVTFFYNGGPGSASLWLHLGSFGPRRLVTGVPSLTATTPFPLLDNMETLLDTTDIVFVDAVGTGYSQAIAPNTNQAFWSVGADAAAFRDFVIRWLAANGRAASPVYLFGESYGGTRTPVVARLLLLAGVPVAGVVLQSPALDYNANCENFPTTKTCTGFVPSYGQAGAWHGRAPSALADSAANAEQLRSFATTTYEPAAAAWLATKAAPTATLATQLQSLTGLAAARWTEDLNLRPVTYRQNLLVGSLLGRYDARVAAANGSALANGDPSINFIAPQFTGAIGDYLRTALGYTSFSTYSGSSNAIDTWDFRHDGLPLPDVIPDLATALALQPKLKVMALGGHHDLATPYFQTERDLARLGGLPNVTVRIYDGGHMTYLDDAARVQQKQDLREFYLKALP